MKKKQLLLCFIAMLTVFSSCKKDPKIETSNSQISLKVNGVLKKATGAESVTASYYKSENTIQVLGRITATEGVELMIYGFHGVGEYTKNDGFYGTYTSDVNLPLDKTYINTDGVIKVTSYTDNLIKGEFKFTGESFANEVKTVTEGTFEGKLMIL